MIYNYLISDTANNLVDVARLNEEITSSTITKALKSIVSNETEITIEFWEQITDQNVLDSIISNHNGEPLVFEEIINTAVISQPPFAEPTFRTKRDATSNWLSVNENQSSNIDYQMPEERYVTGGEVIFKNAKEGDWISAEIVDTLGLIPESYRAVMAEDYPVVARYVIKKWLKPTSVNGYGSFEIDTYPLNAKITQGLVLRVVYNSSSEVGERKIAVNYHLTRRLV